MSEIIIRNLDVTYKARNDHHMKIDNLRIEKGIIVGFFGPNHVGKSTILRVIAQLNDELHFSKNSEILYDDLPYQKKRINPIIVHIPQDYHSSLLPWFSIEKNIRIILIAYRFSTEEIERKVKEFFNSIGFINEKSFLEEYGLFDNEKLKSKKINELSGGQLQIISIIRALIAFPDVLTMDEPFSAIDIYKGKRFRLQILKFIEKYRITTFIVSHVLEDLILLTDSIFILKKEKGVCIIVGEEKIGDQIEGPNLEDEDEQISKALELKTKYSIN